MSDVQKDPHEQSTAALTRQLTELVPRLVRDEIALARVEVTEKGKRAGAGAGLFGVAGLVAWFGVAVLVAAGVLGLATVVDAWLAALIVAVALLLIAGAAALVGRTQLSRALPPTPQEAVSSTREDVRTVKESVHR